MHMHHIFGKTNQGSEHAAAPEYYTGWQIIGDHNCLGSQEFATKSALEYYGDRWDPARPAGIFLKRVCFNTFPVSTTKNEIFQ